MFDSIVDPIDKAVPAEVSNEIFPDSKADLMAFAQVAKVSPQSPSPTMVSNLVNSGSISTAALHADRIAFLTNSGFPFVGPPCFPVPSVLRAETAPPSERTF